MEVVVRHKMKALHIAIGLVVITGVLLTIIFPATGKVIAEDVVVITDVQQICDDYKDILDIRYFRPLG